MSSTFNNGISVRKFHYINFFFNYLGNFSAKPSIISANTELVQSIAFGERGRNDPRIFAACLDLLKNLAPSNVASKYYKRYDRSNGMIGTTIEIFTNLFFYPKLKNFDNITISTFDFIYRMGQSPDILCQEIAIDLCQKINQISQKCENDSSTESNEKTTKIPEYLLSRIVFLFGYVAMKEMVFLDIDVYNNMKYRQDLMEENKNLKSKNKRKTANANVSTMNMSASNALKRLSGTAAEPQQEVSFFFFYSKLKFEIYFTYSQMKC